MKTFLRNALKPITQFHYYSLNYLHFSFPQSNNKRWSEGAENKRNKMEKTNKTETHTAALQQAESEAEINDFVLLSD